MYENPLNLGQSPPGSSALKSKCANVSLSSDGSV